MPDRKTASLLHGAHYLQVLDGLNDDYLKGGNEQTASLRKFDIEFPNVVSARQNVVETITNSKAKQDLTEKDRASLDICNAFPDAGAYLISVKLNAAERIKWLQDALLASQRLNNDVTTQAHLGNLGLAYYELGKLSQAVEYFPRALQLAEKIGDQYHQGAWLGDLGNAYAMMGDHKEAITYHERHLQLSRDISDVRGERHALANLGVSYAHLGNTTKAVEHYRQFLDLAVKSGDRREESQALMNLGFAYYEMGNLDEADRALQKALSIAVELGDKLTQSLVMGGLADIYIDRKEFQESIQILDQAMRLLRDAYDVSAELRLLQSLGNAYTASEDYENALQAFSHLYEVAESVESKAGMCSALANQTSIHRHSGRQDLALETGERGLKLAREINSPFNEAFIRWQMGLVYEIRGEKEKAIRELKTTLEIESRIGSLELEKHREYYRELLSK